MAQVYSQAVVQTIGLQSANHDDNLRGQSAVTPQAPSAAMPSPTPAAAPPTPLFHLPSAEERWRGPVKPLAVRNAVWDDDAGACDFAWRMTRVTGSCRLQQQ